ncbi:hypothetical protein LCGC14_2428480 [marine sediment metagenome]|uniref:Uncharacterized protein n=1 Tax=marine sediment metagenome TaxID=412755 RepID=A0A0F9C9X6_9ZZZZ
MTIEEREELDKIFEEALDCSKYENSNMKQETVSYKLYI